jgi:hypothetical protein
MMSDMRFLLLAIVVTALAGALIGLAFYGLAPQIETLTEALS